MKLALKSLGVSAVIVCGYVLFVFVLFKMGVELDALGAIGTPMDLPMVVYQEVMTVRPAASSWSWMLSFGGNILMYSIPTYLFLWWKEGRGLR